MGVARQVFEPHLYDRLVEAFPATGQLAQRPEQGRKLSLSDQFVNPREFRRFVAGHPLWRDLYAELRSSEFRVRLLEILREAGIDLSLLPTRARCPNVSPRRATRCAAGTSPRAGPGCGARWSSRSCRRRAATSCPTRTRRRRW